MSTSKNVEIFEVGARDGLQNEKVLVPIDVKEWFIQGLAAAGAQDLEMGLFVRSDRVPQMADSAELYSRLRRGELNLRKARPWALIPNLKGLERALEVGVRHIAVFTAASETFTRKNIGMSIDESLLEFADVLRLAKKNKIRARGYVSTAFGCPFEGTIKPKSVLDVSKALLKMGVERVVISDTIGVADPSAIRNFGAKKIALHVHDTRGTALANSLRAFELGIRQFDASAGGLGGCPFAPGATGNLATEDLVYMFERMGVKTGFHLAKLCDLSLAMAEKLRRPIASRAAAAYARSGPEMKRWFS